MGVQSRFPLAARVVAKADPHEWPFSRISAGTVSTFYLLNEFV
jgi:hypothetical protein